MGAYAIGKQNHVPACTRAWRREVVYWPLKRSTVQTLNVQRPPFDVRDQRSASKCAATDTMYKRAHIPAEVSRSHASKLQDLSPPDCEPWASNAVHDLIGL